jgi:signal transduction histidine kinase
MLLAITDITLMFIGLAVMVLLFSSFFIAFTSNQRKKIQHQKDINLLREQQQNQLIEAAVRSEEIERHRIAETLHDEVGAILSSTKLHFQGMKTNNMDERDAQLYEKGKELLDEGIKKVRGISHNLHSNILKEFGLNEAIRHFVTTVTSNTIIKSTVELDNQYNTLTPENDISIYRLVQELMNNILKHSGATELKISSVFTPKNLEITIFHNGRGLTQQSFEELRYNKDGLGLKNIQNRIILLKGSINFSEIENGYLTVIHLPLT